MNSLISVVAMAFLLAPQHPAMPPGMSHEEHLKQMQKDEELKKRGGEAMGFEQDAVTHHFRLAPSGGAIEVTVKNAKDEATIAAVRSHLRSIADEFAHGSFDKPFQTHGEVPAGVPEMRADKDSITYRYEELPQGGIVRIVTTNDRALTAVHQFLRYQITEHQTGDATEVKR
jgi:hypothetical protein